jgi:hypothetical protein
MLIMPVSCTNAGPLLPSEIIISSPNKRREQLRLSGFLTQDEVGYPMRIQLCTSHDYSSFIKHMIDLSQEELDQSTVTVKQDVWTLMAFPLAKLRAQHPTMGEIPRSDWNRVAFATVEDINNYPCNITIWANAKQQLYIGCRREVSNARNSNLEQ